MKKVAIIGHYGFGMNLANGQTIKTKIITEQIEKKHKVLKIDTHGGVKAIIPTIFRSIKALKKCDCVIQMLNENGLKVCVPIMVIFNKIFRCSLQYVVIGGWLPEFLKRHSLIKKCLRQFDWIYVETKTMMIMLQEMGFNNVVVMPNSKDLKIVPKGELVYQNIEPFKLCTFSRVMKEKGIEDAVEAVKLVNTAANKTIFELDIYGQVDNGQTDWFESLKKDFPAYINYRGLVKYDESTNVLKKYFALVFPTYYKGEGFAGTAIDAFSAGIPVIASDWKYNSEIITDGKNGYLYKTCDIEDLASKLKYIAKYPKECNSMKEECINEAEKYRPEIVVACLMDNIG